MKKSLLSVLVLSLATLLVAGCVNNPAVEEELVSDDVVVEMNVEEEIVEEDLDVEEEIVEADVEEEVAE